MIVLGRIVAPFGVQGWVKIHPFGDDPASWRKMSHWWLCSDDSAPDAQWKQYALKACRPHGKSLVAALAEVPDRNAAEAIDGFFIAAPREALPQPESDEYYWADLVGLDVVNRAGVGLGRVVEVADFGAHPLLRVTRSGTAATQEERLIPYVAAVVDAVDLPMRRIVVDWGEDF